MFGPWASLGGFGMPAGGAGPSNHQFGGSGGAAPSNHQFGGGMRNQQMGWTPPGGAAPAWKMGGGAMSNQQMGWSAPSGAGQVGGMGVYSPELMAMLRQRLAGMGYGGQTGMPMGGGYNMVSQPTVYPSAPAMPANPGAFTPYQPPAPATGGEMRSQPMPVRQPAPAPAPTPAPVATAEPIGRRLLSRGFWASR